MCSQTLAGDPAPPQVSGAAAGRAAGCCPAPIPGARCGEPEAQPPPPPPVFRGTAPPRGTASRSACMLWVCWETPSHRMEQQLHLLLLKHGMAQ